MRTAAGVRVVGARGSAQACPAPTDPVRRRRTAGHRRGVAPAAGGAAAVVDQPGGAAGGRAGGGGAGEAVGTACRRPRAGGGFALAHGTRVHDTRAEDTRTPRAESVAAAVVPRRPSPPRPGVRRPRRPPARAARPRRGGRRQGGRPGQGYVGHYPGTQQPGQEGNFALAGHRNTHGEPFRYLPRLRRGDAIEVETGTATYTYDVDSVLPRTSAMDSGVVRAVPRSLVRPGYGYREPGRYITLTTCTPEFTSRYRMAVWGKLVSVRPGSGRPR